MLVYVLQLLRDLFLQIPYPGFAPGPTGGLLTPRPPILNPQLAKPAYALGLVADEENINLATVAVVDLSSGLVSLLLSETCAIERRELSLLKHMLKL